MPDSSGTHLKITTAAMQAVQEAALQGPTSHIEAYSSDLHVLDVLQDSKQIASMILEDWLLLDLEMECWEKASPR